MQRVSRWLFYALVLLALGQAAYHQAHLPERIATHFDLQGKANGWDLRASHIAYQVGLAVLLGGLFGGMGWLVGKLPDALVNIPHREYWMAPGRRTATLGTLAAMLHACGSVVLGFFILFFQQIFVANLSGQLQLKLLPLIIGQFILLAGLVTALMLRFRRPPPTN
ncbi:MAG: DUF1648 domain-containing protein [Cephaloticoccus sp.]|nr:DUF1648 domain-containing protein [Cephaloticoccus sp.]MCF7758918.1 DUF1648 domain-containing protein [Cephaloticoccus sp.]